MKKYLMRPTAALFPLACMLPCFFGGAEMVRRVLNEYFLVQLLSLCSAEAFRNASAREPGLRRVDKRFGGALLVMILGGAAAALLNLYFHPMGGDWKLWIVPLAMGFLINIEQLFEERMWAIGKQVDGVVQGLVFYSLMAGGMIIDAGRGLEGPVAGFYGGCGAALGALIALAAAYITEPPRGFSLLPRNIGFFPKAAVQSLLYPAAVFFLIETMGVIAALAGYVLWRLSRTVCRRAADESRPLNLLLIFASAALVSAGKWIPMAYGFAAVLALVCAAMVFCAPGVRFYIGCALVVAAQAILITGGIPGLEAYAHPMAWAICLIAVVLNLKKAFLRKI